MDRPKRAKKSTKDYENFYYPTSGKRKRINQNQNSREPRRLSNQSPNEVSINSIPSPQPSQAQIQSQAKEVKSTRDKNQSSLRKENLKKNLLQQKVMATQTSQTPRKLEEILNELYTNPDYPSAFGGELKKFIISKDSISKHKQRRKIFKRRKVRNQNSIQRINLTRIFRYLCTGLT